MWRGARNAQACQDFREMRAAIADSGGALPRAARIAPPHRGHRCHRRKRRAVGALLKDFAMGSAVSAMAAHPASFAIILRSDDEALVQSEDRPRRICARCGRPPHRRVSTDQHTASRWFNGPGSTSPRR